MVVHADHPGDHGVAAQIVTLRALRDGDGRGGAHRGDPAVAQQHRLILEHRAAGAVDDAYVFERHDRPLHRDVGAGLLGQSVVALRGGRRGEPRGDGEGENPVSGTTIFDHRIPTIPFTESISFSES
ncbi:MAG: hypothetical protein F4012_01880 [Gemmatimonadales bacterium]|nr:hypothetical protein [Gemmatimonadales bacterium]